MQSHAQMSSHESVAVFLVQVGDFSYAHHKYSQAERSYHAALTEYLRAGGPPIDVATVMIRLSDSFLMQGKLLDAKELKEQAAQILEKQRIELEKMYLLPSYDPPAPSSKLSETETNREVLSFFIFMLFCAAFSAAILSTPLFHFTVPILHSSFMYLR